MPLHVFKEPLETGCDTHNKPNSAQLQNSGKSGPFSKAACTLAGPHTVPLRGAHVKDLNSNLQKKRKTERAARRGQERKVGVEKANT